MCGIVGYAGKKQAAPILLEGLTKLEYRGYDSAGICVQGKNMQLAKTKGRLQALCDQTREGKDLPGRVGIGHTRWATHGAPSDVNSHPHLSESGKIAVVHNGIIENEGVLRRWLEKRGVAFCSETDTEVVSNLVGYYYRESGNFITAVRTAVARIEGSYALGILCEDLPDMVVAVKKDSPLIFGYGEGENFIASDVPAILKHTRKVSYLADGETVIFTADQVAFFDKNGERLKKTPETVAWEVSAAEREGYDHFMLKEIFEQPKALRDTILPRIRNGEVAPDEIKLPEAPVGKIYMVACGSAYYVSVLGKYTLEKICRIPVEAVVASEFRYSDPVLKETDLVIAISQSGETADTLAALREAKRRGAATLAIVNVVGSAIAREADQTLYTGAGPEIAVATTKAFSTQLAAVYLLALRMAGQWKTWSPADLSRCTAALKDLPNKVEKILNRQTLERLQYCASRYYGHKDAFFIGRNTDSAVCLEGSLKLKEVAYLHSEAYPAGELKHGPISLIEPGTLVVAVGTVEPLFEKFLANVREVRARGADVLCVTLERLVGRLEEQAENVITVPETEPIFQPGLSLIPLQLFAYYMALNRGCDVDKPRNLAKSVTVE